VLVSSQLTLHPTSFEEFLEAPKRGSDVLPVVHSHPQTHSRPPKTLDSSGVCFNQSTARTTGLEPATTGSTVRYSNQLSYVPK
jgi:hypothetical protein